MRVCEYIFHRVTTVKILCVLAVLFPTCRIVAQVTFSVPGGFYAQPVEVALTAPQGMAVHYTIDGTFPTAQSALYAGPLKLSPALYSPRNLFLMPDAGVDEWNPPSDVSRVILLRAAAFDEHGVRHGDVETRTFLVKSLMDWKPQLPVLSIAVEPGALFDPDSGIFSPEGFDSEQSYTTGNFNQHGREWERLAHVEFYEQGGGGFSQWIGIRVHGGSTRMKMQKSLKLYARQEYGEKRIRYPLFESLTYRSFKRLVLKPFTASWSQAGVQDRLAQAMAEGMPFASLASRPVTVYINGEYWGIYYLQESPDEHLVAQIDDVESDSVTVIGSWKGLAEHGSGRDFIALIDWLASADLSDTLQYEHLCSQIDIDNFIDYQLFEAFIANVDWPANNMRCYRYGNEPWRWLFYDGDACFVNPKEDMSAVMTYVGDETWPSSSLSTLCWRRLLQSPAFVERCGSRLFELSRTAFLYSVTDPLLQKIIDEVSDEVKWQARRFRRPEGVVSWNDAIGRVDKFLRKRRDSYLDGMMKMLSPQGTDSLDYTAYPNPATDKLYLRVKGGTMGWQTMYLYDLVGRMVICREFFFTVSEKEISLDVSALPRGMYLLRISQTGPTCRVVLQ